MLSISPAIAAQLGSDSNSWPWSRNLWPWGGALLAFLFAFVVYLRTLAPTIYGLDSASLTKAAYSLGLVHPPGYPLYLLIGFLFTRLPFGDVGYRMNLMSALFGALAIALHYLLLLKLTRRPLAALAASLLLAYSFFFWASSVMAEVYTLHICLMAALLLVGLTWQERQDQRWLYLLALLYGFSLTNHLSSLLLLPGLLYWLLAINSRQLLRLRQLGLMLILFTVALLLYFYLPWRYAADPTNVGAMPIQVASWQDVLEVISARVFWKLMFAYSWPELWGQVGSYFYALWGNFLGVGLVIGGVGSVVMFQKQRNLAIALTLMYLANGVFFIGYRVPDKRLMFLPTYFIWAIWIGLGYDWLLAQMADRPPGGTAATRSINKRWQGVVYLFCLALALATLVINFQYADLSNDWRTYEQAKRIFETVEPGAQVLAVFWFEVAPLEYLQVVENHRPDIRVLRLNQITPTELYTLLKAKGNVHPFYSTSDPGWSIYGYKWEYIERCHCYRIKGEEE